MYPTPHFVTMGLKSPSLRRRRLKWDSMARLLLPSLYPHTERPISSFVMTV